MSTETKHPNGSTHDDQPSETWANRRDALLARPEVEPRDDWKLDHARPTDLNPIRAVQRWYVVEHYTIGKGQHLRSHVFPSRIHAKRWAESLGMKERRRSLYGTRTHVYEIVEVSPPTERES